jgi:hypothetical protein
LYKTTHPNRLEMDTLPVTLCELNGNIFQSTGGRTARLLGKCGLHQAKSKVWGTRRGNALSCPVYEEDENYLAVTGSGASQSGAAERALSGRGSRHRAQLAVISHHGERQSHDSPGSNNPTTNVSRHHSGTGKANSTLSFPYMSNS